MPQQFIVNEVMVGLRKLEGERKKKRESRSEKVGLLLFLNVRQAL